MTDSYEDVPGAAAAARATLARQYALQRIAAMIDDTGPAVRAIDRGAQYAGLTLDEVDAAELEIRRTYLDESGREYLLRVAREHLMLSQIPEPDGPSPDAEGYRSDGGTAL